MLYLPDPVIAPVVTPYDDSVLKTAIDTLKANETVDDGTVSALEVLLKAKDAALDKAVSDLAKRVDAIPTQTVTAQEASITPVFDSLSPSKLLVPATAMNGATVVSGVTGSVMVNEGRVHSFGRTSTPPAPNTWGGNLTIAPTTGACKLRFGITSAIPGTIEVSINGATPLTASNTGFGWSGATPEIQTFIDGGYSWFEIAIAQSASPIAVAIKIPTGRGLLPTIYAPDAITSLIPSEPTGLKLSDPRSGKEMIYRPSQFLTANNLPAPTYGNTVATKTELAAIQGKPLQMIGCLEDGKVYLWKSPTIDRMTNTWNSSLGRNPLSVWAKYPKRVGDGWIPQDVVYVPDTTWKPAGNLNSDGNIIYTCKLISGTIKSIAYEYSDPADINVFGTASYDFTTINAWTDSSYWGGKTNFGFSTLSGGRVVKNVTCIRDDGSIILCSMNNAGSVTGSVRNVRINDMPVDVTVLG